MSRIFSNFESRIVETGEICLTYSDISFTPADPPATWHKCDSLSVRLRRRPHLAPVQPAGGRADRHQWADLLGGQRSRPRPDLGLLPGLDSSQQAGP